jgi:hypothetical protein
MYWECELEPYRKTVQQYWHIALTVMPSAHIATLQCWLYMFTCSLLRQTQKRSHINTKILQECKLTLLHTHLNTNIKKL